MCKCQSEFSISGLVDFYHRSTAADIWRYRDRDTLMKLTMQLLSNIMPNRYIKLWQVASKQFLWILATVVRAAESDVDQTWILGYLQWMLMLQICNVMTVGSRIQNVDVLHSRVWDLRGATRGSCCWSKIGDCKPLLMFPNEQISLAAAATQRQFIHIASAGRLGRVKLRDAASWSLLAKPKWAACIKTQSA